jgi:hypothetical protein
MAAPVPEIMEILGRIHETPYLPPFFGLGAV